MTQIRIIVVNLECSQKNYIFTDRIHWKYFQTKPIIQFVTIFYVLMPVAHIYSICYTVHRVDSTFISDMTPEMELKCRISNHINRFLSRNLIKVGEKLLYEWERRLHTFPCLPSFPSSSYFSFPFEINEQNPSMSTFPGPVHKCETKWIVIWNRNTYQYQKQEGLCLFAWEE